MVPTYRALPRVIAVVAETIGTDYVVCSAYDTRSFAKGYVELSTIEDRGRRLSGGPSKEWRRLGRGFKLLPSLPERLLPLFGSHRSRLEAATASPRGCSRPRSSWRPCVWRGSARSLVG